MFKGNRKFIFFLVLGFAVLIMMENYAPKPVNWRLSFSKKDKIAYGDFVLFDFLEDLFPGKDIITAQDPIYNVLHNRNLNGFSYLVINQVFYPDSLDVKELLQFAAAGNHIFIAANRYTGEFADTLRLETDELFLPYFPVIDSLLKDADTMGIHLVNPRLKADKPWYYKRIMTTYFSSFDSSNATILGEDKEGNANFIKLSLGNGAVFLHTLPRVFTNYHLADKVNSQYAFKALSYLPVSHVIWDEYYKVGRSQVNTPLRFLLSSPPLKAAYYLLLLSLLLFVIFALKRRQRMIPIIKPFRNTTLEFVDTIGTLYFQQGSHKNIADKKIMHFMQYVRSRFHVKTDEMDTPFFDKVANLSGIDREEVLGTFRYCDFIKAKSMVSSEQLIKLNKLIRHFKLNSKR